MKGTLITSEEFTRYLRISKKTLYRMVKKKMFSRTRAGNRYWKEELEDYLSDLNGYDIRIKHI